MPTIKANRAGNSGAEEKFIQLFCDVFGPERGQYYKIMELSEFRIEGRNYSMLAHIDSSFNIRIGDILIDENEHTFRFAGCAMIHYNHDQYPECLKVSDMLLEGDPETIGEYLAFFKRPSIEGE